MVVPKEPKDKNKMTTIWIERALAQELRKLGDMDDTYTTVIRRLLDGSNPEKKGAQDGDQEHESAGVSHNKG